MTPEHKAKLQAARIAGSVQKPHRMMVFSDDVAEYASKYVPASALKCYRKAMSGRSKATGIKAKCLQCSNFDRKEITLCAAVICPLWPYRPFRGKKA